MNSTCGYCSKTVYPFEKIEAGQSYHKSCFKCMNPSCGIHLTLKTVQVSKNKIFCSKHLLQPKHTSVVDVSISHALNVPKKSVEGLQKTIVGSRDQQTSTRVNSSSVLPTTDIPAKDLAPRPVEKQREFHSNIVSNSSAASSEDPHSKNSILPKIRTHHSIIAPRVSFDRIKSHESLTRVVASHEEDSNNEKNTTIFQDNVEKESGYIPELNSAKVTLVNDSVGPMESDLIPASDLQEEDDEWA